MPGRASLFPHACQPADSATAPYQPLQDKGAEICSLGSQAAPMLLQAFRTGGAEAKLALAGVQQAGLNNDTCNDIAFGAFKAAVELNRNGSSANLTDYRL